MATDYAPDVGWLVEPDPRSRTRASVGVARPSGRRKPSLGAPSPTRPIARPSLDVGSVRSPGRHPSTAPLPACPEAPDEAHVRHRSSSCSPSPLVRPGKASRPGPLPRPSAVSTPTSSPTEPIAIAQSIASAISGVVPERPTSGGQPYDPAIRGTRRLCVGQAGCTEAGAEDDSIRITLTVPDGWSGLESSIIPSVERYLPPGGAGLLFGRGGWSVHRLAGLSGDPDRTPRPDRTSRRVRPSMSS